VDVAGRQDRLGLIFVLLACQTTLNPSLAVADDFRVGSTHLKCPLSLACAFLSIHTLANTGGHFEYLLIFFVKKSRLYEV
jgi:hypothetical protein